MSRSSLTVILSQAPGKNPHRRAKEDALATALRTEPNLEVVLIPHLSHLGLANPAREFLQSIPGNLVLLAGSIPGRPFGCFIS